MDWLLLIAGIFLVLASLYTLLQTHRYYLVVMEGKKSRKKRIYNGFIALVADGKRLEVKLCDDGWKYRIDEGDLKPFVAGKEPTLGGYKFSVSTNDGDRLIRLKIGLGSMAVSLAALFAICVLRIVPEDVNDPVIVAEGQSDGEETVAPVHKTAASAVSIKPTANFTQYINDTNSTALRVETAEDEIIATDYNDGKYTTKDLQGKRICLYYRASDGTDIFFVGQYDEENRWTGECLTNAYKEGLLLYSSNDVYAGGKRTSYTRISKDEDTWAYTRRIVADGVNDGDTWNYTYEEYPIGNLSADRPLESDMATPDAVKERVKNNLIKHYHGRYNSQMQPDDTTGAAYSILFNNDRTTKLIFWGTFSNGYYDVGEEIVLAGDGKYYYYYGKFEENQCLKGSGEDNSDIYVAQRECLIEERRELIQAKPFATEIIWTDEDESRIISVRSAVGVEIADCVKRRGGLS